MAPFPHSAPRATISAENPAGTDGFELVEFAHADPGALREVFAQMGAKPFIGAKTLHVPAIVGIGGSLIYFVDQYGDANPYGDFTWLGAENAGSAMANSII